jgi:uncharacterized protein (DUF427 family)
MAVTNAPLRKIPGPDHPIAIAPAPGRVVVTFADKVIADSKRALILKEASYQPVYYIPREDVRMEWLTATEHATYCPYKGAAAYFTLGGADRTEENAVWTYDEPYEAVQQIGGYLAFYPNKVDAIEVR